jgi:DNA-binding Lrp family transcriptional regulator
MNRQITGLPTEALLTQLEFENLSSSAATLIVKRLLRALAIVPVTAILSKTALEGEDIFSSGTTSGISEVLSAVLIDLRRHEEKFEDFNSKLNEFAESAKTVDGSRAVRQSAGAAERTADPGKVKRIARLLLNGLLPASRAADNQLRVMHVAEFTRIAEILTDTDVLVLRAIYRPQKPVIEKYRELVLGREQSEERLLQDEWFQAVFAAWKETVFSAENGTIRFVDVHSALQRLEAQGLICRTTSQVVSSDITSTPFGLLDLGALFVEQALTYDRYQLP